jgi:hypothetical protein
MAPDLNFDALTVDQLYALILECGHNLARRAQQPAVVSSPVTPVPADRTLDANAIAAALGVKRRWVFDHIDDLPFVRRVSRKCLAASERDVRRWRESQKP